MLEVFVVLELGSCPGKLTKVSVSQEDGLVVAFVNILQVLP